MNKTENILYSYDARQDWYLHNATRFQNTQNWEKLGLIEKEEIVAKIGNNFGQWKIWRVREKGQKRLLGMVFICTWHLKKLYKKI